MEQLPENIPEDLAEKWLKGKLTPEEQAIFDQWYESPSDDEVIVDATSREDFSALMLTHIKNGEKAPAYKKPGTASRRRWLVTAVVTVAASFLIAFGLFRYMGSGAEKADNSQDLSMSIAQMVQPGGHKATLTLSDGQTIALDAAQKGLLFSLGDLTVSKADTGLLVYKANGHGADQPASYTPSYNTLSTPKGGKFSLTLPDGTKVWLNASSSIRYPTAFNGRERKVELKGEAYFEVVHNEKMPFRVQVGNVLVEDMGTQFVINGYADEPELKVSLLEGLVKVTPPSSLKSKVLQPGQQAKVDHKGQMQVIKDADVLAELAWKNGLFNFAGSDLKNIMRQLERWYNITVDYAPGLPDYHFGGQTYMNVSLSEVLKVLELNGIHFKVEKAAHQKPVKITIEP